MTNHPKDIFNKRKPSPQSSRSPLQNPHRYMPQVLPAPPAASCLNDNSDTYQRCWSNEPLSSIHYGNTKWSCVLCLMKDFPACDLYEQNFGKIVIQMEKSCGHLNIIHHFVNEQHVPCVISSLESVKQMQKKISTNIEPETAILKKHHTVSHPRWDPERPDTTIPNPLLGSKNPPRWFDSWPVWFRDSWEAFF